MNKQTSILEKVSFDFPLEILKQAEESGEFHIVGYAATTDFDLQGDIITQEALKGSSLDLLKNSTVLLNHDVKQAIGKVTKAEFDKHGLLIDVLISKTEPDIIQKIKEGVLNKFSIRGEVLEREKRFMPEFNREVNVIKRMTLVEVSLVSVPANPEAKAIGWYVSKALHESDAHMKGGNLMPKEETVIDENPTDQSPPDQSAPGKTPPDQSSPGKNTPDTEPSDEKPDVPKADIAKGKNPKPKPPNTDSSSSKASSKDDSESKPSKKTKKGDDDGSDELNAIWLLLDILAGMGPSVAPIALQLKSLIEQMIEAEEADESDDTPDASAQDQTMKSIKPLSPEEMGILIAAEVKKQVASALSAIPPMRKGFIQQEPEAEQVKKTFESLPPEKKLKVALALQQ